MHKSPIIILGAPRSGTNMLRDILCQLDGITTWDCDEINPIWKYKNYKNTDELSPSDLTHNIKKYILGKFKKLSVDKKLVLEKTCANTLRPFFVKSIFPEAKFIYIYRNGFDCAISAKKKSKKLFDLGYQFKKLKHAPLLSYPFLVYEKLFVRSWGPIYEGLHDDFKSLTEIEIAAKQWMKCNEKCITFASKINHNQIICINYDQFVEDSRFHLLRILNFLELKNDFLSQIDFKHIHKSSVGKGFQELKPAERQMISVFIDKVNKKLEYL